MGPPIDAARPDATGAGRGDGTGRGTGPGAGVGTGASGRGSSTQGNLECRYPNPVGCHGQRTIEDALALFALLH